MLLILTPKSIANLMQVQASGSGLALGIKNEEVCSICWVEVILTYVGIILDNTQAF
jgi:hypothetical protein